MDAKGFFQCPNKVPEGFPPPTIDLKDLEKFPENRAGISIDINSIITSEVISAQLQAALSLLPCNQKPISIFLPSTLKKKSSNPHDKYSVAVIYSDVSRENDIKLWAV